MKGSRVLVGTYRLLGARSAEVFVASSRCPCVKIDEMFCLKPYPTAGGRSMPRVFDCLKPYFKKWKSATTFNPVHGGFFLGTVPSSDHGDVVWEPFGGLCRRGRYSGRTMGFE